MAISVEQFIERLSESGLLSAAEVSAFQDGLPPDKRPRDVQTLAAGLVKAGKLTKYQAQAVYQGKTKGLVFGQYVVLDKLGEGGMGVVLKARHRRMDRLVAIKVLSSAAVKQAGSVERFHREAQAAAKLSHPNIVTAYDADEHQGMHYLAMEYVEGRDLASIVKDHGPLGIREAVECILQAARGLQYAHEQGIVHRDIKPGNLLLDKKGTVKILDMGLARIAGTEMAAGGPERLTTTGQVMGTCDYMAPEQSLDTHQADHRADIYALGCTLYRLLTGNPPYRAETFAKLFLMHLEAPIPSLCDTRPEVPEALDAIAQRMLAKKPEDRQQSMAEVVAELEAVLAALSGQSAMPAAAKAESSNAALSRSLAFLQEDRPLGTLGKQKKPAVVEETQPSVSQQETGTNILGKMKRAVDKARRRPLVLAGIGGGLVFLLGIIMVLTLRHGTLLVEIDEDLGKDVQVVVSQGGEKVQLVDARSGWTLSLSAGKYDLAVEGGGDQFLLDSHTITVTRGGQVKVKATLKPPLLAVAPFDAKQARKHQQCWARYLGVPVEITNSIGMKLVLIPPGEFTMGEGGEAHKVRITKAFYLGKYEVTQEEWEAVLGKANNLSLFKGPKNPVENDTWKDCQFFLKKLGEKCGAAEGNYRLPTEAQWEYACRAGSTGGWCFGDSELELDDYGWYEKNSEKKTHPVGEKKPSAWGLYDMHGNVWEWCADWFGQDYYKASPGSDPAGPPSGSGRVLRGGGWNHSAGRCRSTGRENGNEPGGRHDLGLRACLVLPDTAAERAKMSRTTETAQPSGGSTANKPSRPELEPEPVAVKPGEPLSDMALVVGPAAVAGARSWTIETVGHRGEVTTLAYSPDGGRLATGGADGTIRIWDPATGKLVRAILGASAPILSLCWSPDGSMLAIEVCFSHKAMIVEVESGRLLRCDLRDFYAIGYDRAGLRWSPDGRRIAYHRKDDVVIATLPPGLHEVLLRGVGGTFQKVAWSPDGATVATYSGKGGFIIWDAASGTQRKKLTNQGMNPAAAWSPDGTMLAVGGDKAMVLDAKTWQVRHSFPGAGPLAAWSPDSRTVAFGGGHSEHIEARDVETGNVRWTFHVYFPTEFAFSPDGKTVAAGHEECPDLLFLDAASGQRRSMIPGHPMFGGPSCIAAMGAAFSPDGSQFAAGRDNEIRFWDVKSGNPIGGCHSGGGYPTIAWSADGKIIAIPDGSQTQLWDAASRECVNQVPGGSGVEARCIGLSADAKTLVNSDDKAIRLWDVAAKRQRFEIPREIPREDPHYSLSPDGKTLAVATEQGAKLYDATTGVPTASLEGAERPWPLAWSPDGKTLAGLRGGTIHLWDVASGRHTSDAPSKAGAGWWNSACWLDEATLALGNACDAYVWDRRNHTILRTVRGYLTYYRGCCFSPAARLVAFPGQALVRMRSLEDGRPLYTLLWLRGDLIGVVGPAGHWRGAPGLEKEFVYVVQTDAGQETLTPEGFAKKYGWKNDPSKAVPKAGGHPEVTRPKIAGGKPEAAKSPFIGPDGKWNLPPGAPPPAVAPFDEKKAKEHQEAWAKHLGVPVEITNSIGMKLVLIPPGEFMMGSPKELIEEELKRPDTDQWYKERLPSEGPQHRVRITRPFYLGTYLVTQQEYQRVMGTNPSEFSATGKRKDKVAGQDTKQFPVETVSWDDAVEFCRKLSEMPEERSAGRTYRLPSEAQWEYACRAGNTGRYGFILGGKPVPKEYDENGLSDYGWFNGNSASMPHAVGLKRPSAWGLYDMHGNLWEWCQDWYDKDYYSNTPTDDPAGPSGGSDRVFRGGDWNFPARLCRSADRTNGAPGGRISGLGLRVSRVLADKPNGRRTGPSTE